MSRRCSQCERSLPENSFYKRTRGGLQYYCKKCTAKRIQELKRNLKRECVEYKGGKCEACGYDRAMAALEFHHKDRTQKEKAISRFKCAHLNEALRKELNQCSLLCANCHRERHEI